MNVSVFGLGYVGCVSLACIAKNGFRVIGVDVDADKINLINNKRATVYEKGLDKTIIENKNYISATNNPSEAILKSEISFICVGTPNKKNGELNMEYIFNVISSIAPSIKAKNKLHIIVIRSTVFPGTCDLIEDYLSINFNLIKEKNFIVISNPEFLREGSAIEDYFNPPYTLIGSDNLYGIKKMKKIYKKVNSEIIITKRKISEVIKYVNNSYHALKVSFANEIGNISKSLGIDSLELMDIFCKDKILNISSYYFKPGFAYGGSCLPKDLLGLQTIGKKNNLDLPLLNSISKSNNLQIERSYNLINSLKKNNILILGATFKKNTDDLRNSPSVLLINKLNNSKEKNIKVFDPNLERLNSKIISDYFDESLVTYNVDTAISESNIICLMLNYKIFVDKIKTTNDKIVIDFCNSQNKLSKIKNYIGINW
tara:strand:- start:16699 stop:17982 length:1284 start_codon:yes stop_codon:yes gene_type:complete